jgi:predicted aconitase
MLELLLNDKAPLGLVFHEQEEILTLGVLIAKLMFGKSIPVVILDDDAFDLLKNGEQISISGGVVHIGSRSQFPLSSLPDAAVKLSDAEGRMLAGEIGEASRIAMEAILHFAKLQGATSLISVSRVHVDACYYCGPSTLLFVQRLRALKAKFVVPTTLNALSVDRRRWRELGTDPTFGVAASKVADLYMAMGARVSFTCAPYLLDDKPSKGEHIGWAESNAVVFANSVLGARTQKYPDFMDVFIGITGVAPNAGNHLDEGRRPTLHIHAPRFEKVDDSFWPVLGHWIGEIAGSRIPFIAGLEHLSPSLSDLKAFGAAFATTSSASMFHIQGVTPEASNADILEASRGLNPVKLRSNDLYDTHRRLNSAIDESVGLISLGNPHFSFEEFATLSKLCQSRNMNSRIRMVITTSRETFEKASSAGFIQHLATFGSEVITDTCWCMITEPIIPKEARNLMTNSAKYAHYGPGMVKRGVHFGSLAECVEAACARQHVYRKPIYTAIE